MPQYIVRLVHSATSGDQHTGYHGPYLTLSGACAASDALAEHYLMQPLLLDGSQCRTDCSVETLHDPPRAAGTLGRERATRDGMN